MNADQRTLVLIKPDAVARGLVGAVLSRFEGKGLRIAAMQQRTIDAAMADRHYADHTAQPWYPPLRDFVTSGPLVAMILEGPSAIEAVRTLIGAYSLSNRENLVHASDSEKSAAAEIALWFPESA